MIERRPRSVCFDTVRTLESMTARCHRYSKIGKKNWKAISSHTGRNSKSRCRPNKRGQGAT
ncbi:hypothetical protein CLOSTHATH_03548 [Hungatella hathewayi DSM 13479]|uniref:Uncharacterized protein n=1 Tax=Hungatella hathewayi DSM 13479 TaxID=566550 RepID=D3AIV8_9FIRM|nr:hypothetical protein CLOSTHATH_03548 [Hungatella hathewayi DSM 13479]